MKLGARYLVYSNSDVIGWSELEHRDPAMGVAFGRFVPDATYSKIRDSIRAASRSPNRFEAQSAFRLSVRTPAGAILETVTIADVSNNSTPDDVELEVLGVTDFHVHFGGDA